MQLNPNTDLPILSISILLPLITALYITFFIGKSKSPHKEIYVMYVTILSAILTLISTIYLVVQFDKEDSQYQFVEHYKWIPQIGLEIMLGVDGISLTLILITALLTIICIVASLFTIKTQIKEFLVCFLLLESFCIGAFSSLNLLLFYFFFEITLIPMYLIIVGWGGENRVYAAFKFFLYTFLGSLGFLVAIIYIYLQSQTLDLTLLPEILKTFPTNIQHYLWLAIFISFAIKIPMLPFHTWLPDAHVQAPTAGSVMLAGILLKFGAYGLLRILLPLLPISSLHFSNYILILSFIAVIYGSLVAIRQTDMKNMIAYSSIAHMGYATGGIFSFTKIGLQGAIFQMISHAFISSALFLMIGVLYERLHTKEIAKYGGSAAYMPKFAVFFMIATLASIGLPATSGFIGEFYSIVGIFQVNMIFAALTALGIILGAVYMLRLYKSLMFGTVPEQNKTLLYDLKAYEIFAISPLIILIIYFGVSPMWLIKIIDGAIQNILAYL